jgi:hypothetical protein
MICSYDNCNNEFTPKTHNQKYCSDECCRIATNENIKKAYYEKKARLSGKKRVCKSKDCESILSRYNDSNICEKCVSAKKEKQRKELLEMIKRVTS